MAPLQTLTTALASKDPLLAADAARLLGEARAVSAVPALLAYAKNSRHHHKAAGLHALAILAPLATSALRARAQKNLAQILVHPNVHDDWYWYCHRAVKASAALALLALAPPTIDTAAGEKYLHQLADKNDDVFFAWLAPAILQLPDSPANNKLKARLTLDVLLNPDPSSTRLTEPGLLTMKAQTLALLPSKESSAALIELTKFHSRYVRGAAALALLHSDPGKKNRAFVQKLHAKDPTAFVQIKTALALALDDPAARSPDHPIQKSLARHAITPHPDPIDTAAALEALAQFPHKSHLPILQKQLKNPHPYLRQTALESLQKLNSSAARSAAQSLAKDPNPRVRLQAAKNLLAPQT